MLTNRSCGHPHTATLFPQLPWSGWSKWLHNQVNVILFGSFQWAFVSLFRNFHWLQEVSRPLSHQDREDVVQQQSITHKFQKQLGHCVSIKTESNDMLKCQNLILVPIKPHQQHTSFNLDHFTISWPTFAHFEVEGSHTSQRHWKGPVAKLGIIPTSICLGREETTEV